MTVKAVSMGVDSKNGKYLVNVKNTEAKGMIGGAGIVRQFDTKEDAKQYIKAVNKSGVDVFEKKDSNDKVEFVRHEGDTFTFSAN